ncbi:MAG: arsenite methyltransferase [Myxococcota bacterium]
MMTKAEADFGSTASATRVTPNGDQHREVVKCAYQGVAQGEAASKAPQAASVAKALGYRAEDIETHGGGNLGLGCGNPTAQAQLREGDCVLDLGSGAGFDALIARSIVGAEGHVIGVDMTRAMLGRARANAAQQGVSDNVEFREGTIEALPVRDASVDVAISNCVVNLSPDKPRVFDEVLRVLKPGGRLVFSDILLDGALPPEIAASVEALVGCIAGASQVSEYEQALAEAGFRDIRITRKAGGEGFAAYLDPLAQALRESTTEDQRRQALAVVGSYTIEASKAA